MKSHYQRVSRSCNDDLGQGGFCNALWKDEEGVFCSIAAAEGRRSCNCNFSIDSCHLVVYEHQQELFQKIQCGGEQIGEPTLTGVCQDFEPSEWVRKKFGV